MTPETWIAFALMNLAYSASPGPNAAVIAAAAARGGVRGGLGALLGVLLAELLWAGLAILIVTGALDPAWLVPGLLETGGALALILLGGAMLLRRPAGPARPRIPGSPGAAPLGKALLVGLANPVTVVFFVSVAPLFLTASTVSPPAALAFLLAAFLSCAVAHAPYVGLAGIAGPRLPRWTERGCGLFLCALGAHGLATAAL